MPRDKDYKDVLTLVEPQSRVLDLGCGDGDLLVLLRQRKNAAVMGLDIQEDMIISCISKGIPVCQGNIDDGLSSYEDKSFDYVILSRTLQVIKNIPFVLQEILRVGRRAIVSVPNFGYFYTRFQLFTTGRMPVHKELPYEWYNTPNIHLCTHKDFTDLCRKLGIRVERQLPMVHGRFISPLLTNLRATEVCYLLSES